MRATTRAVAAAAILALLTASAIAQQPQAPAPSGRGRIGGIGIGAYPQRTVDDQAAVERGRVGVQRQLRVLPRRRHARRRRRAEPAALVARARRPERRTDRSCDPRRPPDRGMPAFAMTPDQIADIAAFMHSFRVAGYDASRDRPVVDSRRQRRRGGEILCLDLRLVPLGDGRSAGRRHPHRRPSPAATELADAGQHGRARRPPPARPRPPTVTVTLPSGEKVEGQLDRIDDFAVSLRIADGARRSFRVARGVAGERCRSAAASSGAAADLQGRRHSQRHGLSEHAEMNGKPTRSDDTKLRGFVCLLALVVSAALSAQQTGLDPAEILKPLSDSWPTYSGDYSGRRYSTLKQINQTNVKNLGLAWTTARDRRTGRADDRCRPSGPRRRRSSRTASATTSSWAQRQSRARCLP